MRNTSLILDNYLEKAIHDKKNVVEILDYLLAEEAKTKKNRAVENQIKMSGFPYRKTLEQFDFDFQPSINKEQIMELATMRFVENKENVVFLGTPGVVKTHLAVSLGMIAAQHRYSTYYINCHNLITQLNKAHYENRLQERLKNYAKYKVLIIDEIGYLPMDIQGANLFFQLIAKRYEKNTTIFTSPLWIIDSINPNNSYYSTKKDSKTMIFESFCLFLYGYNHSAICCIQACNTGSIHDDNFLN